MLITNSLHVLCFGDSITAGYSRAGSVFHPYGIALKQTLQTALPSWNISIDVEGLGGDRAVSPPGVMLPRMTELYQDVHPIWPYDYAIILAGTNDLNTERPPNEIWPALLQLYSIPLTNNTKVLSLTITDCGACAPSVAEGRAYLNPRIMEYQKENYSAYDLNRAVPWDMPTRKRTEIWDDALHFTAKGYDLIGTLLAKKLLELVRAEEPEMRPEL